MATYQTAKTQYIAGGDGTFAYRRLGQSEGTPLLCLIHFRGTMDKWDPLLINALAQARPVILVDYLGIGQSSGRVATSFAASAADLADFLARLAVREVDILGFSIGGLVAQLVALNTARSALRVRRLLICGSSASAGPDMPVTSNDYGTAATAAELKIEQFEELFFSHDDVGKRACAAYWARLAERTKETSGEDPSDWASQGLKDEGKAMAAQGQAYAAILNPETSTGRDGTYDRLGELDMPVLVAQGSVSRLLSADTASG